MSTKTEPTMTTQVAALTALLIAFVCGIIVGACLMQAWMTL